MFSSDRDTLRHQYIDAWRKYREGLPLTPLEDMIARVVVDHPEYHALLESGEKGMQREYLPEDGETNPFLHMGMHLAIREQVSTDRPAGIRAVHRTLSERHGGPVEAEHQMIDCLAETLWQAQRNQRPPDEQAYLRNLKALIRS
ncbi:DUF1841 family protein [Methylonatrum kenyense]|uniref:DUF1841 family protein n=1 Tax=Methylonatrum kenyense TaxID=455253 RepID=UPI0020BEA6D4|nr:DUF1841 family protein [Methylonatrum kenyense]MCK8514839.1 DUF1841 family protein [Methylonatrum kenyense]